MYSLILAITVRNIIKWRIAGTVLYYIIVYDFIVLLGLSDFDILVLHIVHSSTNTENKTQPIIITRMITLNKIKPKKKGLMWKLPVVLGLISLVHISLSRKSIPKEIKQTEVTSLTADDIQLVTLTTYNNNNNRSDSEMRGRIANDQTETNDNKSADINTSDAGMSGGIANDQTETNDNKSADNTDQVFIPMYSTSTNGDGKIALLLDVHGVDNEYHMQTEIESIIHVPNEAKIMVKLNPSRDRICKKPRIFGRLSGKYLTMIYWDTDAHEKMDHEYNVGSETKISRKATFNNTIRTDVITGYYSLPSEGRYFIDIIGLMCNDFPFEYDFNSICLENVDHMHLTANGAFVDVTTTSKNLADEFVFQSTYATSAAAAVHGYWKWSNKTVAPIPLKTRYQRQNCRSGEMSVKRVCTETSDLDRFEPYTFEWSGNHEDTDEPHIDLKNYKYTGKNRGNETFKICTGGQSHSRELLTHITYLLDVYNVSNVEVGQVPMNRPHEMKGRRWEFNRALNCNIIILGLGQWSAGKSPQKVTPGTTFPTYQKDLEEGILSWKSSNINFVIRKSHYNALGDIRNTCPPTDWRSPPVIDGYNEISRSLAQKHNITYLDTGSLMDPMWDSPGDFCHYRGLEGRTEALFLLKNVLQMNVKHNWIKPAQKDKAS